MQRTKQDLIQEIVANFDWSKIHQVMQALDWKWARNDAFRVPQLGELVIESQRLLNDCYDCLVKSYNQDTMLIATGGFEATATKYEDGEIVLGLKFVVTEFSN